MNKPCIRLPLIWAAVTLLVLGDGAVGSVAANPVTLENALAGNKTAGWDAWDAPNNLIEGYASEVSVAPGDQLHLHVSTKPAASYRVEIYRIGWYGGAGARLITCLPSCSGTKSGAPGTTPTPEATTGLIAATWPTTDTVTIGPDWVSGYFVAKLRITSGTNAGKVGTVPFVVKAPPTRGKSALIQVPVNTWQAYNNWGGKSLYDSNSTAGRAYKVSFDRPYTPNTEILFDHEIQLVRFLEREGYDVAYQTDLDTHLNPASLTGYSVVISSGHDEYWTKDIRDAFELARDTGTSLAFFGANDAYWQARYENGGRIMVEYKDATLDPQTDPALKTDQFRNLIPARPECQLMGVQYQEGTIPYGTPLHYRDYAVNTQTLNDPWFVGTGFAENGILPVAVGYEYDSIAPGCNAAATPIFFQYSGGSASETAHATRYVAASGARVFATGTMHWAWLLDDWFRSADPTGHVVDPRVQQFTRNVLGDLLQPHAPANYPPVAVIASNATDLLVGKSATLTDRSADPDGTIASRAWDLNGDGLFDDGNDSTDDVSFPVTGSYKVSLKVTDDQGVASIASTTLNVLPQGIPVGNTTTNPSFEIGTKAGWTSWQGSIAVADVPDAVDGGKVARVTLSSGTAFSIDDAPNSITSGTAGHVYKASAWVRAATASAIGKTVRIKIREITAAGVVVQDIGSAPLTLTGSGSFQTLYVLATAQQSDNQIDVRISMDPAAPGDAFETDLISLVDQTANGSPGSPPTATMTPSRNPVAVLQPVTLFDGSSAPDPATRLTRVWDLANADKYDWGAGPTASRIFFAPGTYPVKLKVTDPDGRSAITTSNLVVVSCLSCPTGNLTTNPSFEIWTRGWTPFQATVDRIADAAATDGNYVARVISTTGTSFTLSDSPRSVLNTVAGDRYQGNAMIRAGSSQSIGKSVNVRIREWTPAGTIVQDVAGPSVKLTNGFLPLSVTARAIQPGNQLDIRISMSGTAGDAFDVDSLTLVQLGP